MHHTNATGCLFAGIGAEIHCIVWRYNPSVKVRPRAKVSGGRLFSLPVLASRPFCLSWPFLWAEPKPSRKTRFSAPTSEEFRLRDRCTLLAVQFEGSIHVVPSDRLAAAGKPGVAELADALDSKSSGT